MTVMSTPTKARLGLRVTKGALKHPTAARRVARTVRPIAKPVLIRVVATPLLVRLGVIPARHPIRTAGRVAAGAAIGAGAVYFLDPQSGRTRRHQVAKLVA